MTERHETRGAGGECLRVFPLSNSPPDKVVLDAEQGGGGGESGRDGYMALGMGHLTPLIPLFALFAGSKGSVATGTQIRFNALSLSRLDFEFCIR